jgi:hypothetical protein
MLRTTALFILLANIVACQSGEIAESTGGKNTGRESLALKNGADAANIKDAAPLILPAEEKRPTRHLPGTVITTATGKYNYLVLSDGTLAPFAAAGLVAESGYAPEAVVTVTAEELRCYGRSASITVALDFDATGQIADGALVKEKGLSAVYAVSEGVAWPILNERVFLTAGYSFAAVKEIPAGSLKKSVEAIGDCVAKIACLDLDYLFSCAADDEVEEIPIDREPSDYINSAHDAALPLVPKDGGAGAADLPPMPAVAAPTIVVLPDAGLRPDLSWVWDGAGSRLCLNAAYFAGGKTAVLLLWSGPGAAATQGVVADEDNGKFCWEFKSKEKGLYYFWADVPVLSCNEGICPRDNNPDNGALYMTAPMATPRAREWLSCVAATGCDGVAYWDKQTFAPMGGN